MIFCRGVAKARILSGRGRLLASSQKYTKGSSEKQSQTVPADPEENVQKVAAPDCAFQSAAGGAEAITARQWLERTADEYG